MRRAGLFVLTLLVPLALPACHAKGSSGTKAAEPTSGASATGHAAASAGAPTTAKGSFDGTWKVTKLGWAPKGCAVPLDTLPAWDQAAWKKVEADGNFHMQFDLEADKQGRFKIRLAEQGTGAGRHIVEYECSGDDVDACKEVPTQTFKWVDGAWRYEETSSAFPGKGQCGTEKVVQTLTRDGGAVKMVKRWTILSWPAPGGSVINCDQGKRPADAKATCEKILAFEASKI